MKKEKQRKAIIRDTILFGIILIIAIILISVFPEKRKITLNASKEFFIEMILILPAVMMLIGLFTAFISKEMIVKYLGKSAGIKGIFLAIFMGALPTGPLYIAFPMASALFKKRRSHFEHYCFSFSLGMHQNPSGNGRTPIPRIKIYGGKTFFNNCFYN